MKVTTPVDAETGIHKVVIIAKLSRYEKLKNALNTLGVTGMTVTQVMGCGIQKVIKVRTGEEDLDALKDVE